MAPRRSTLRLARLADALRPSPALNPPPLSSAASSAASAVDELAELDFETHGVKVHRGALDPGLISEAQQHIEWLTETHPELRPENFGHTLVAADPFWVRLVSDPRLLAIVNDLLCGEPFACVMTNYLCKLPKSDKYVPWHQVRKHPLSKAP